MKKVGLLFAIIATGVGVALTYHVFENVVHAAIDLIWYDWFNTDENRLLVMPLAISLSLVYFASQHYLDKKSEHTEEKGLGEMPPPALKRYLKILFIGFFSLIAGASLGPEAILVPACMTLGALVGKTISKDSQVIKLLTAAGIIALFTAFFHSMIVGLLSVLLVTKQAKTKLSSTLILTAVVATLSAYITLNLLSGEGFVSLPHYDWRINTATVLGSIILVGAGYLSIMAMSTAHLGFKRILQASQDKSWVIKAAVAGFGITALYLLGGPLIEFTGNRSITPMFEEASSLGLLGLVWVLLTKIAVISWSKASGYRGGMIFPTIFVACVLIAIVQLYFSDFNMIYGIIAVLIGAFMANAKTRILV